MSPPDGSARFEYLLILKYLSILRSDMLIVMTQNPAAVDDDRPSLRERKRLRTHAAIYEAAMELFEHRPYSEVTVEEICERAEVGRATFFRFYGTKAALLLEFNRRLAQRARQAIDDRAPHNAPEKLRIVTAIIADAWADSSPSMRAMAMEMLHRPETTVGGESLHPELIELVADIIRDGTQRHQLRGESLPPEFIAAVVVTALASCVLTWFNTPLIDLRQALEQTIELLLQGLTKPS
jgi:AcrR family transcriptional regulator